MDNDTIQIKNGNLFSVNDGEFTLENLNKYWVTELIRSDKNILNIEKYKKYSYINLCSDLEDYYDLVDSSYINDLVPSMLYRFNSINENDFFWVGFPNSNKLNIDNEKWNCFTLSFCINTEPLKSFVFDSIEDVLGFIESNKI